LFVKDLRTAKLLPDRIEKTGSVVWANDNRTMFYTVEDAAKRPYRLYRHRVGSTGRDDLLFEEKDEMFELGAKKSRSKAYIFLISASHTASEVRYIRTDQPDSEWKLMAAREPNHEYYPEHNGEFFYVRTNDTGRNFRLVRAPVDHPGRQHWEEVLPHRANVMLEKTEFFKNYYVLLEREEGLPQMRVTDLRTGEWHHIKFPEATYLALPESNKEYNTNQFRYRYQSLVASDSIFDYDIDQRTSKLLKRTEVLGGYDSTRYQTERIYATAKDGVRVPISLVYLKGLQRDGTAPLYLTGYGSYGIPFSVSFDSSRFSLIDRGVVFAVAHIRGGGDLGKPWHDDGRMMKKKNTFTDFIAAAEYLVGQRYSSKDRLVIGGASAGGLLMGAVTNMRPDLFKGWWQRFLSWM
jgi:oligopeptidase B